MLIDSEIRVLDKGNDVLPFIETIKEKADSEKTALGFLPDNVYEQAVLQEKLLVAAFLKKDDLFYVGHLLYGGTYPHGKVFQLYVDRNFRGRGIATILVNALIERLERFCYLSISAKVAADLHDANSVWSKLGFITVRTISGGASRNRKINIRVRDLNTPSLVNWSDTDSLQYDEDLMLLERLSDRSPNYVLDLNVLFDVTKNRLRAEFAGQIFKAGFDDLIRLSVTDEFINELQRTSNDLRNDPILRIALNFPQLVAPPIHKRDTIIQALSQIVFPSKTKTKSLKQQDVSDLTC